MQAAVNTGALRKRHDRRTAEIDPAARGGRSLVSAPAGSAAGRRSRRPRDDRWPSSPSATPGRFQLRIACGRRSGRYRHRAKSKFWTMSRSRIAARWSIQWWSRGNPWAASRQASAPRFTKRARSMPTDSHLASTFADYLMPGPTEVPAVRIFHMETPSPYTEFGIKGMGEGGAIAPPAVIFNAVNDALKPLGVELTETPADARAACWKRSSAPRRRRHCPVGAHEGGAFRLRPAGRPASGHSRAEQGRGAAPKLLAGGQSLGPMLNSRLARPSLLVDVSRLGSLARVEDIGRAWRIGACVTHSRIEDMRGGPARRRRDAVQVAAVIAYRTIRNRGTIGGSIAHADPAADWPLALAALGATVNIRKRQRCASHAARKIPAGRFHHSVA